jgi:peptidoglycan/LPS O-acetylase OafA/YrhL
MVHFGRLGVVLFFCISGFLIGRILIQHRLSYEKGAYTRRKALIDFYLRRSLRIFPLYFGVILFFWLIGYAPITNQIAWHVSYTSNYGQILGIDMANVAHFWSLCVEEQFYLIVPFIILWTPINALCKTMLVALLIAFAGKTFIAFYSHSWLVTTRGLHGNLEGLIVGILLAYLNHSECTEKTKRILFLTSILGAIGFMSLQLSRFLHEGDQWVFFDRPYYAALCDILISMMVSNIIFRCFNWRPQNTRTIGAIAYLGKISYGIYVYHFLMIPFIPSWLSTIGISITSVDQSMASFTLCSVLAIGAAVLSWHFYEYPILRLRDSVPGFRAVSFSQRNCPKAPTGLSTNG